MDALSSLREWVLQKRAERLDAINAKTALCRNSHVANELDSAYDEAKAVYLEIVIEIDRRMDLL